MAMTLLKARKNPDGTTHLCVHLDTTRTLEDNSPDPAWVRRYDWPQKPSNVTQIDYLAQVKRETKMLAELEANNMQAAEGTSLPGEGGEL